VSSALVAVALVLTSTGSTAAAGDPLRARQWGLDQVGVPQAWTRTQGSGVVVAVIDSGVDFGHPDLAGALLRGKSFTGSPVRDDCGHGTEVAGIIAARRGNGRGIAGVAPGVRILPLKDGDGCTVDTTQQIAAIRYAAAHGAKVINISQGTQPVVGDAIDAAAFAQEEQAAVDEAWSRGALVVAGAGNDAVPWCGSPASLRHVLCVGAVDVDRQRSYYSQGELRQDVDMLMAPGGGFETELVWTTTGDVQGPTGRVSARGYGQVEGTSFATPFVSGVAALLFARGMSVQQVHDRLLRTARDLGPPGRDPLYGWGEVDAAAALGAR
jgi:subtilisin family serine protease